ncbi:MAG: ATP synthase F1 subunit delta [Flavobacteriales bacterium]|nr:ATP synthase F1 subunit delta [Flavobacteriales bacterium]
MKNISLCTRYAKAYVELAIEKGELDKAVEEAKALGVYLLENEQVAQMVLSPLVSREEKIKGLAEAVKGKTAVENFVNLIIEKGRAEYLSDILTAVDKLNDSIKNICHVAVETAVSLTAVQMAEIEKRMKQATGASRVVLHATVDEKLLGGMKITIDDRVWDGSLRGRLDEIKKKFQ